jgi:hypothetical protein
LNPFELNSHPSVKFSFHLFSPPTMKHFPLIVSCAFAVLSYLFTSNVATAQTPSAAFTANTASYSTGGGTLTLTSTLTYTGQTPTVYAFSVQLPVGWKFVSQSLGAGVSASVSPAVDDNVLEWAFSGFPANQLSWTFIVSYPAGLSGNQSIMVQTAQYRSPTTNLTVAPITLAAALPSAPAITSHPQSRTATAGENVTFAVTATGTTPMSYQWRRNGTSISGATSSSYTISSVQTGNGGDYTVDISNSVGSATSNAATLSVSTLPRVGNQPQSQTVSAGASVTFSVTAFGAGALSYQWSKDNVPILGATAANFTLSSAQTRDAGTYTVHVWNSDGSTTSNSATLSVSASAVAVRLVNISTRAYCSSGNGVTIGGFVISGDSPKQVLMRAIGPTLVKHGLPQNEVLLDPRMELHKGAPTIASNDNWADNANAASIATTGTRIGAAPLDENDTKSAALLLTLQPGVYSFIVTGASGSSGIVLVEVYDAD